MSPEISLKFHSSFQKTTRIYFRFVKINVNTKKLYKWKIGLEIRPHRILENLVKQKRILFYMVRIKRKKILAIKNLSNNSNNFKILTCNKIRVQIFQLQPLKSPSKKNNKTRKISMKQIKAPCKYKYSNTRSFEENIKRTRIT